jgi:hypothetical protein
MNVIIQKLTGIEFNVGRFTVGSKLVIDGKQGSGNNDDKDQRANDGKEQRWKEQKIS